MASFARCIRTVRPSTLSRFAAKAPAFRASCCWQAPVPARAFSATTIRELRKYTKDHEWVDLSADKKSCVIGISEFAAEELGDVVYVELPEEGKVVAAGDAVGAVESVKSAADINAPISGKVTAVNMVLEEKPGTINKLPEDDSHGGGWMAKMSVDDQGLQEFEGLMDPEAYKVHIGSEE